MSEDATATADHPPAGPRATTPGSGGPTEPSATGDADGGDDFERHVGRLVELSVQRGHDAFADVPWDDPDYAVESTDPRLRLPSFDPLAATDWYRSLSEAEQARVGLQRIGVNLRVGWEFENLLQQGLLARGYRMGNRDASFPYLHHEVIEESQHTLMFYEFIRRYTPEVQGMPSALRRLADPSVHVICRRWPALFFFMVLGGEIPVDVLQRRLLREEELHPLVERITTIHVEEEARHVSYANEELRRRVPTMRATGRHGLAVAVPGLLGIMARLMVHPTPWLRRTHDVPRDDWARARRLPASRQLLADSVARIRSLCDELDLLTPAAVRAWRAAGLWGE